MKSKVFSLVPQFEKFIKASVRGTRLKPDGTRLRKNSIINYYYVLNYLKAFEEESKVKIRVRTLTGNNQRLFMQEKKILAAFLPAFQQLSI